ncbi:MAG: helix-turn-helix domain-containing protein [Deltaproteobacteria bacterium]|nr:helix-turn-helix domain-containing protein [Deltaproteobacteria bacterium]
MAGSIGSMKQAMGLLAEGLPGLSSSARHFVRDHPREAHLAVAVALETAAAQCEVEERDAVVDIPERLRPFVVRRGGEDILGVSEAAARLKVSRTTIYDWVERRILLAWRSTKRGLNIPAAQILGPGRVVAGLADVAAAVGDPELAWAFLTQEWPFEDTAALPLELLKAGHIEDVLGAAPGFGSSFT